MANPYFRFKKFTVYHDQCAMKVGTDGVLLGAWTRIGDARNALDVGTGTGLIALMLAQRSNEQLSIDAIDIDQGAIAQTEANVLRSGFKGIGYQLISLQGYRDVSPKKYDLIVSNPPYFSSSLHSPDKQRTMARHTESLTINEFIDNSAQLLSDEGRLSLIFPYADKDLIVSLAEQSNLFLTRLTTVFTTPMAQPKRILLEFSKKQMEWTSDSLIIEEARHKYSDEFTTLVKDFYLKL